MKIQIITIVLTTLATNAMEQHPGRQNLVVNQDYINQLHTITKKVNYHPVRLENKISKLMKTNHTWQLLLSNQKTAGLIVEQISNDNESEMYPIAIILNTPGTIAWLKNYIHNNPAKHTEILDFINHVRCNIYASQEEFPELNKTLNAIEQEITQAEENKFN